ncbi:VOC family protein [Nonomuraea sp. NPDC059194]|uniref:VOC family protein n=1 Tax=Nonomuraea sp. NPDC059194 TaxID=3346764 RepID=UPI0036CCC4AB
MSTKIFINLPVADVKAAVGFFSGLGFTFEAEFGADHSACMVIGENIFAMLVSEPFFKDITSRDVADTKAVQEVALAISIDSREQVDALIEGAVSGGGQEAGEPQDEEYMYSRGFRDLDGHLWNVLYLPPAN